MRIERTYTHEDRTYLGLTAGEWADELVATFAWLGLLFLIALYAA